GLDLLLESAARQSPQTAPLINSLREALRKVMEKRPRYHCQQCGFTPNLLYWQCPSCKHWASIAPQDQLAEPAKPA
ncbi:MAG: hypothetical protein HYZ32_02800, partial [Hydrocarboniphaga effusa]|nr:hypothetical protein [Hydrocarboniphaga effusa]